MGPLTQVSNKICAIINDFKIFLLLSEVKLTQLREPRYFWTSEQTHDSVNPRFLIERNFRFCSLLKFNQKYSIKNISSPTKQTQLQNLSFERLAAYTI